MIYDPRRRALELRQRIIDSMSPDELRLSGAEPMNESGRTPEHFEVAAYLRQYANTFERKAFIEWGGDFGASHVAEVRALADRIEAGWDGRLGNPASEKDRKLLRKIATALASQEDDELLREPLQRNTRHWDEASRAFFAFLGD